MSRDALVVGVNSYQYLPGLNTPAQDAEAIAHCLHSDGDFRVYRLPEIIQDGAPRVGKKTLVTLAELETALVRLFKPKGNNIPHTALFYFSGHGLQKDIGIQEGYLATSDTNPSAGFYGLSLFWLRRLLQESPVRQRVILLDCCHSGELLNYLEADPGAHSGTDRLFMAASREYEVAYESLTGKYSVFTQALLEGLNPQRVATGVVTNYALTDWVSNALKREQQQPLFENSGSEILLTRGQALPTLVKPDLAPEICPYRGLECFDEAYAEYFFGREDLTDQLIDKLRTHNFVAVLGASGSGKSSLIRAGLIHKLRQGQHFSGSDRWRIQLITPTDQPLKSLAAAFVNSKAPTIDRAEHLRRAETLLREGDTGLTHLVRASLISSKHGRNERLLLIIDQFEEVFTLCQGPQAERDRHRFFNALLTAQKEAGDCLTIVLVIRADFFNKCSLYTNLATQIEQNLVTVTPLTYEQIKSSILKPAEKVGLVCEPNLVYNILLDIVGAPGELPLLQYTLLELWQNRLKDREGVNPARLTLDAYQELGGVRGTLQKRANEVFYSLTAEEQQVVKRVFIALTQLGEGTEDTRRRVLKSELVSPQFPVELVDQVLEKLVQAKLIITNQIMVTSTRQEKIDQEFANVSTALRLAQLKQGKSTQRAAQAQISMGRLGRSQKSNPSPSRLGSVAAHSGELLPTLLPCSNAGYQETVDVAHETLIRHWSLLRTWLDENREMLRRQRQIERMAKEWDCADRLCTPEYLLRGSRLAEAEDFLATYPNELSALAEQFLALSQAESQRSQKELRLVQMAVPCTLLVALAVTFNQYRAAIQTQAEKDYQLQVATSRQQAAIAQSILQDSDGNPATALLISRVAAEEGGRTYEAQASLRAALQRFRLQAAFRGHQGAVNRLVFSANQQQLATAGIDGTIRIWSLRHQSVQQVLQWQPSPHIGGKAGAKLPAIQAVAFSPDGQTIAAIAEGSAEVKVWSIPSGQLQFTLMATALPLTHLSLSSGWIAASAGQQVFVWQLDSGRLATQFSESGTVQDLQFSPDSQSLLTVSHLAVTLRSTQRWQQARALSTSSPLVAATFNSTGSLLGTTSQDGAVQLWDTKTAKLYQSLKGLQGQSKRQQQIHFSPDNQVVAAIDQMDGVPPSLWDARTGSPLGQLRGHEGRLTASQFSPDGSLIATADTTGAVYLWSTAMGSEFPTLSMGNKKIQWVTLDTGVTAITADGALQRWDLTLPLPSDRPQDSPGLIEKGTQVAKAITSKQLVNFALKIESPPWLRQKVSPPSPASPQSQPTPQSTPEQATATANEPFVRGQFNLNLPPGKIWTSLAFAKNQRSLVTVDQRGRIQVWQIRPNLSLQPLRPLFLPASAIGIRAVVISPDGQKVAGFGPDRHIYLWDTPSGQLLRTLEGQQQPILSVQFSPDGERLISTSQDRTTRIWQLTPGKLLGRFSHPAAVNQAHFSPDGQLIVTASQDGTARVLDASTGKLRVILAGHRDAVLDASFSPDGRTIATVSRDGTARLWDATTGTEESLMRPLQANGQTTALTQVMFSPNGQYLATLSDTGQIYLWASSWDGLLKLARDRSVGQLKPTECLRYLRLPPSACPIIEARK